MLALTVIAQTRPPPHIGPYVWGVIAAVFCVMLGGALVLHLRKKMLEREGEKAATASFMEKLRDMHRRGEISDAEYEQTRKTIASRVSHIMDTQRSGGLFELPDPKRRITRSGEPGPIAPPSAGASSPRPGDMTASTPEIDALRRAPPGYDLTGERLPEPNDRP